MYENQTYEEILARSLERVSTDVDKREGSIVMNAIAPVSAEHANIYLLLDSIILNGYADTANVREYLVLRCKERGIIPYDATPAVLRGKFNMEIPLESRFNLNELNYRAIAFIDSADGYFYYQMECETVGTEGNKYFGELSPIEFIDVNLAGELTELLIPAEDDEDMESLRERYSKSFSSTSFGGNKQDYKDRVNAMDGVGGTIVIPVWAGGGTVKLIIINSDYNKASDVLVSTVQQAVDPSPQGTGSGIAPIGHKVTVVSAVEKQVAVSSTFTLEDNYTWSQLKETVEGIIKEYLLELRKAWEDGSLVVRISQLETRLLTIEGVLDISGTKINGVESNLILQQDELPVFGGVTNG